MLRRRSRARPQPESTSIEPERRCHVGVGAESGWSPERETDGLLPATGALGKRTRAANCRVPGGGREAFAGLETSLYLYACAA
jgi:hypothetical protein